MHFCWIAGSLLCATGLLAEPPKVKQATGEIIRTKGKIQTGSSSRIELELPYLAIVRIGSNADFKFTSDAKEMSLSNGTLMLSMPKETAGVTIESGSVITALSKGDLEMSNVGGRAKVIALNGKIAVSLAANRSDRRRLRAGTNGRCPSWRDHHAADCRHQAKQASQDLRSPEHGAVPRLAGHQAERHQPGTAQTVCHRWIRSRRWESDDPGRTGHNGGDDCKNGSG